MRVCRIDKATAQAIIVAKHYRKSLGIFWHGFGLFRDERIVGVCVFGQPSASIQKHAFSCRTFPLLELTRLVVDEGINNGASFLIANSLKMLKKPCAVVSYADTAQGHTGIVYQATNWLYTGAVKAHDSFYLVNGEKLHPITIRDRFGATKPAQWAKSNGVETIKPMPKHRYFYLLGKKQETKAMRALLNYRVECGYPKGEKAMYNSGPSCASVLSATKTGGRLSPESSQSRQRISHVQPQWFGELV